MTKLEVKHATVIDALGRKRTGWIVFENGQPGYPHETKEKAIRAAHFTAELRVVNGTVPRVVIID